MIGTPLKIDEDLQCICFTVQQAKDHEGALEKDLASAKELARRALAQPCPSAAAAGGNNPVAAVLRAPA